MSKLSKETMYTELSIQIGVLEAKVDKILQLLLEQQKPYIANNDFAGGIGDGFDPERVYLHISNRTPYQTTGIVDDETFREEFK